jgi:hypothetical protein
MIEFFVIQGGFMHFKFNNSAFKSFLKIYFQWFVILFWALWIGRAYLDLSFNAWPSGGKDYVQIMQNQYIWTLLPKCGACFFWNGLTNGGAPAFIDILAGWLHPITILATLKYGLFNSGKVIVLASLVMAGIAQWWLGKVFNLSPTSRMWTSLLFVSSGALTGRMEIGSVALVLSTAACTLVIPPAINLARYGGIKNTIVLGIILGLALISGQGYLQIGLLFSITPMILILVMENSPDKFLYIRSNWRYFVFALLLAALIAAPLLVPLAHISPTFSKDGDTTFSSSQPLQYTVLNLVINDPDFFYGNVLGKSAYPFRYINYIGWIPVLFALWGIIHAFKHSKKLLIAICVAAGLALIASSSELFKWLSVIISENTLAGLRNPGVIQGLAVPYILVMAGLGVDDWFAKKWPKISLNLLATNHGLFAINTDTIKWLLLLLLMGLALKSTADFSKRWLYVDKAPFDLNELIKPLVTADAQWVQPPYGEAAWLLPAIDHGMKIRAYYLPWGIGTPDLPKAYLEMTRTKEDVNLPEYKETIGDLQVLARPENVYASIGDGQTTKTCQATSIGGIIDVNCENSISGVLTVLERSWDGWAVWVDGQKQPLLAGPWLAVKTSPGKHLISFRYQPWDAPLGIGLAFLGWAIAIIGFYRPTILSSTAALLYGKRASDHADTDGGT